MAIIFQMWEKKRCGFHQYGKANAFQTQVTFTLPFLTVSFRHTHNSDGQRNNMHVTFATTQHIDAEYGNLHVDVSV